MRNLLAFLALFATAASANAQSAITVDYRPDGKGGYELVATQWQQHLHHVETNDHTRVSLLEDDSQYWLVYNQKESFFFPKGDARSTTTPDGYTVLFLKDDEGNVVNVRYRAAGEAKTIVGLQAKVNGTPIKYGGDVF